MARWQGEIYLVDSYFKDLDIS